MKKSAHLYSIRRRFNLFVHRWHRRIGITASLFLIWMAVSGWLLNHTDNFDLAHRFLTSDFITTHYGIRSDLPLHAYAAGGHQLIIGDDAAVFDGKKIPMTFSQVRGMAVSGNLLFVADASQLILLNANGELIDRIATPIAIERIGEGCGGVVIANAQKQIATKEGIDFTDCSESAEWSREEPLTESQREQLEPLLRTGISAERLLLDLHSGRFFGAWGPFFVDVLGIGLIVLALSGVWLFVRHSGRRRTHQLH